MTENVNIFEDFDDDEMAAMVVTDEDGNELEFMVVDEFAHGGVNYLIWVDANEIDSDDAEAFIVKQVPSDDDEEFAFEPISEEEQGQLEDMLKNRMAEFGIDIE